MNWFILAVKNTFNYKGRARRREYGWFILINFLLQFTLQILAGVADLLGLTFLATGFSLVYALGTIFLWLTGLSLTARRLHDLGYSGWWQLGIPLIVIVLLIIAIIMGGSLGNDSGAILVVILGSIGALFLLAFSLWLIFKDGQRFTNKYGEDPKVIAPSSPENPPQPPLVV